MERLEEDVSEYDGDGDDDDEVTVALEFIHDAVHDNEMLNDDRNDVIIRTYPTHKPSTVAVVPFSFVVFGDTWFAHILRWVVDQRWHVYLLAAWMIFIGVLTAVLFQFFSSLSFFIIISIVSYIFFIIEMNRMDANMLGRLVHQFEWWYLFMTTLVATVVPMVSYSTRDQQQSDAYLCAEVGLRRPNFFIASMSLICMDSMLLVPRRLKIAFTVAFAVSFVLTFIDDHINDPEPNPIGMCVLTCSDSRRMRLAASVTMFLWTLKYLVKSCIRPADLLVVRSNVHYIMVIKRPSRRTQPPVCFTPAVIADHVRQGMRVLVQTEGVDEREWYLRRVASRRRCSVLTTTTATVLLKPVLAMEEHVFSPVLRVKWLASVPHFAAYPYILVVWVFAICVLATLQPIENYALLVFSVMPTVAFFIVELTRCDVRIVLGLFDQFEFWFLLYNLVLHVVTGWVGAYHEEGWSLRLYRSTITFSYPTFFVAMVFVFLLDSMVYIPHRLKLIISTMSCLNLLRILISNIVNTQEAMPVAVCFIYCSDTLRLRMMSTLPLFAFNLKFVVKSYLKPGDFLIVKSDINCVIDALSNSGGGDGGGEPVIARRERTVVIGKLPLATTTSTGTGGTEGTGSSSAKVSL